MKQIPIVTDRFLSQTVPGFHQYILTPTPRLCYVSEHLCRMLQCPAEDLLRQDVDAYAAKVMPADREAYAAFLAQAESGSLEYSLQRGDGSQCIVNDSLTVETLPDGTKLASSVLTELTELKQACEQLRFLSDTLPCGFLRYTCDPQPRLTYINDRMLQMLGFDDRPESLAHLSLCRENIYLMIPMEERSRFARYLDRVRENDAPLAGEMTVQRCDGSRAYFFGWVTKCVNEQGEEEFQSACMDVTDRYLMKKAQQTARYLTALTEVYDLVFEFDPTAKTVKCVHSRETSRFKLIEQLPMQMEEAVERWVNDTVHPENQAQVRAYFEACFRGEIREEQQIRYLARSTDGIQRRYAGVFLHMEGGGSLFCCRRLAEEPELAAVDSAQHGENPRVQIRTFGYFDVFVEGKPIAFRNEKSKELFALLVDRRGGFVSSEEAIGFLWEDETANPVTLSRYRKVALRLKNLLEEYGIADIVESVSGKRRIVVDRVQCDLYEHLADRSKQLFKGSYLSNYSWGESTLAELSGEHLW